MKNILKTILNVKALKTDKKQLLILSDDWGSVRIRSKQDQETLVKKGLTVNNRFDKYDSLETNEDLELLYEVLTKHKDQLGNHPVITAVTNVGNPDFDKISASNFKTYAYETIDQTYQRYPDSERVLSLIKQGIEQKLFIPQSHGREHVQVNWWIKELQNKNSYARKFFEHEFFFLDNTLLKYDYRNRDIVASFDVLTQNDIDNQNIIAEDSLKIFNELFEFKSMIFTPPAMYYSPKIEETLFKNGIHWLDVGRFLRVPKVGGAESYQFNYLGRKKKSGIRVLVRNGMFEPNILATDNGLDRAMFDIEQAFKAKQPAILSNHRAAFVGRIDTRNRAKGLKALDELLGKVLEKWPDVEFITPDQL